MGLEEAREKKRKEMEEAKRKREEEQAAREKEKKRMKEEMMELQRSTRQMQERQDEKNIQESRWKKVTKLTTLFKKKNTEDKQVVSSTLAAENMEAQIRARKADNFSANLDSNHLSELKKKKKEADLKAEEKDTSMKIRSRTTSPDVNRPPS